VFFQDLNAPNPFSADVSAPIGELTTLPKLRSRLGRGISTPYPSSLDAFGVWILAPMAPRFLGLRTWPDPRCERDTASYQILKDTLIVNTRLHLHVWSSRGSLVTMVTPDVQN